ncbi:hypothetical protein TRFO_21277 [Tritrichomonas foetus]|uniref:Cilia- and flagella-associated protein 157 n=1 Tax=Tritrichomonas foetus TaxID=1144522 RepID=A0A1J4KK73_9EUKA|nr:hypothetical protein TRFO_21277 [Tritrichomonas foetus]|eukprot:OHT09749.1 hypothetical protein TRFO_21277 [Tritrichomonas foetus]
MSNKKESQEGNPKQVTKELELKAAVMSTDIMNQRSTREDAAHLVLQFKRQLQAAALTVEKKAETQQSRIEFLTRTLSSAEKERDRLFNRLRQIQNEVESQKDKYDQQVEAMQYQSREVEQNYKAKIHSALQQLRGLREFQEHKHQMDERMRNLSNQIAKERKERTAELAAIHKKLVAQREYYEHQLASKLSEADEYATKFEDLDLDRATTKIIHETEQRREAIKAENNMAAEVIKRNDQLRHQIQDLEQQCKVLDDSEKNLTTQAVDLKAKLEDTKKKVNESIDMSKARLQQLQERMSNKISDLSKRLEEDRKTKENLTRELALAQHQLAFAEGQRDERLKKDHNLLTVMNEAAIFILTSLELQEKDPSKEEIASHSSALNAVIRKIGNVSQDLTGVEPKPIPDSTQTASAQTDMKTRGFVCSGKPSAVTAAVRKARAQAKDTDFRNQPEYQRIFGKESKSPGNAKTKVVRIQRTGK